MARRCPGALALVLLALFVAVGCAQGPPSAPSLDVERPRDVSAEASDTPRDLPRAAPLDLGEVLRDAQARLVRAIAAREAVRARLDAPTLDALRESAAHLEVPPASTPPIGLGPERAEAMAQAARARELVAAREQQLLRRSIEAYRLDAEVA